MQRKATSHDVAKLAGVSRTAVSLVLNGHGDGNIAPDRQEAIRAAARELDYTPNSVAVSLRNQKTHTLGVVTDAIATHAFGGQVLTGAADAALAEGFLLLVIDTGADDDREAAAFETLRDRRVDGLMFAALSLRPFHAPDFMRRMPAALANCYEPDNAVTSVGCDEVAGGRQATTLLIEHGHRDVAMLAGTPELVATDRRVEGYVSAGRAAGIEARAPITTGWAIDDGYRAALQVLDAPDRPSGIVCANDRVAVGVVLAAARLGLSVPADLSVVGYDDDENVASHMAPPLTTIRLPHYEMGHAAVKALLQRIHGDDTAPEQVLLECPAVVRDSVTTPRPR
jgi:LacI family transcriptional regulator, galactose operon repressor